MEITLATAGVIALISAVIQVLKGIGLKKQYAPLVSIVLGVSYFVGYSGLDIGTVINGFASGLTAVGLYSIGGKTVLKTLSGKN